MKNCNKKIIIGAFLFVICVLVFKFFNNRKNIIEGHGGGGGGGGGRGGGGGGFGHGGHGLGGGYYGNNNYYYGGGTSYDIPEYVCNEDDDIYSCPYRYYGIIY
jgi:hypothetical protein